MATLGNWPTRRARPMGFSMQLDAFIQGLDALIDERQALRRDDPGAGNYGCEACSACDNCRFCVACSSCEDCTYCEECVDCVSCTQSKRCVSCEKNSHCEDCRDCEGSRYLTLCVECRDSVHCLGCVGLEGAEFHVLNVKYTRKEYFKLLHGLREEMEVRLATGWRPEPIGLESEELEAPEAFEARDDGDAHDDLDEPHEPGVSVASDRGGGESPWLPVASGPAPEPEPEETPTGSHSSGFVRPSRPSRPQRSAPRGRDPGASEPLGLRRGRRPRRGG